MSSALQNVLWSDSKTFLMGAVFSKHEDKSLYEKKLTAYSDCVSPSAMFNRAIDESTEP